MKPEHESLDSADNPNGLDAAIDEMLEGSERSSQWRSYINALLERQQRLERDLEEADTPAEKDSLKAKLNEIDEQIAVLREEEGITKFIEDAVKYSYEVRRLSEG